MDTSAGYSRVQIVLHWIVMALVAAQYIFRDDIADAWLSWHPGQPFAIDPRIVADIVVGQLVLVLTGWRLVLRLQLGAPPPDAVAVLRGVSTLTHAGFYAVLAALSISGAVAWVGDVTPAAQLHAVLARTLMALIALHLFVALLRPVVLKTEMMRRMIQPEA